MTSTNNSSEDIVVAPFQGYTDVSDLDNECWDECKPVQIMSLWSGPEAPAPRHAEARVCWTNEAIGVRFICHQHEPLIASATPVTNKKTLGLWDRDVCEIFLAPDPAKPERYFEFEAAPTGEWVDLGILITPSGRETDWDYASGMSTTAKVEPGQVTVGIRIPWSESIPKPWRGDEWRVNLFRCVSLDPVMRYLAWRPTGTPEPNFHVPEAFGVLRFA
jgi:Carbohydrate family 9 binding domain-like